LGEDEHAKALERQRKLDAEENALFVEKMKQEVEEMVEIFSEMH
jgi:hypothetical protein